MVILSGIPPYVASVNIELTYMCAGEFAVNNRIRSTFKIYTVLVNAVQKLHHAILR